MKKEGLSHLLKNVKEMKDKAAKLGKETVKTAGVVKQAVNVAVSTTKGVAEKASKAIDKDTISQGLKTTSQGVDVVAKGVRLASKGADAVAKTMEKASKNMKDMRDKLKR